MQPKQAWLLHSDRQFLQPILIVRSRVSLENQLKNTTLCNGYLNTKGTVIDQTLLVLPYPIVTIELIAHQWICHAHSFQTQSVHKPEGNTPLWKHSIAKSFHKHHLLGWQFFFELWKVSNTTFFFFNVRLMMKRWYVLVLGELAQSGICNNRIEWKGVNKYGETFFGWLFTGSK